METPKERLDRLEAESRQALSSATEAGPARPLTDRPAVVNAEYEIRTWIEDNVYYGPIPGDNNARLVQDLGVVDSLGIAEIAEWIDKTYGITTTTNEITPANFQSINAMAAYIRRKLAGGTISASPQ